MNSRLKNLLLGLVFICFGIGIGIGIGAGIWSDGDELIDQGPDNPIDIGPFVEFYDEKLGNITGIIDHRTVAHGGVVKFLGEFRIILHLTTFEFLGIPYAERPKRFTSPVEKALPMIFNATTYGYQCPDINLNATLDRQNGMVNNKFVSLGPQ